MELGKAIRAILSRYWLERSVDAHPSYDNLEPIIQSLFLKARTRPSEEVMNYLKKVIGHSGRIKMEKVVMVAQTFTHKTDCGVVVQIPIESIIEYQGQTKAIIYPNNTTNLKQTCRYQNTRFVRSTTVWRCPGLFLRNAQLN